MVKPAARLLAAAVILMIALPTQAIVIAPGTGATQLANAIIGPGVILVGTPTLTGAMGQSGTFTGGNGSVGFGSGVVLGSGNVSDIPGNNVTGTETLSNELEVSNQLSTATGASGYGPLTTLVGQQTFDASVLSFQFQFTGGVGGDIGVKYVFASEEYLNWVNTEFNDVFGFYLDGVNIALTPTSAPVSVNSINPVTNSAYYINNVPNTNGYPAANKDFQFDGLTTVLTAQMFGLAPGTHTMTFALADAGDDILDAAVFIQQGSFSPESAQPVPEPGTMLLLGSGLFGLAGYRRRKRKN